MKYRAHAVFILILLLMVSACKASDNANTASPEFSFFEPAVEVGFTPVDSSQLIDAEEPPESPSVVITPRIEPPDAYPWAPQDRPIYFHTLEESGATRSEWGPYLAKIGTAPYNVPSEIGEPDKELSRFNFVVSPLLDKDARLVDLVPKEVQESRKAVPVFIGLGGPFIDEYYHVFECDSRHNVGWYTEFDRSDPEENKRYVFYSYGFGYHMGDYVVFCRRNVSFGPPVAWDYVNLSVYVLTDHEYDTYEHVPPYLIERIEHRNAFPKLPEKFGKLWVEIMSKGHEAYMYHRTEPEYLPYAPPEKYAALSVSFYYPEYGTGAEVERVFHVHSRIVSELLVHPKYQVKENN